MSNRVDIKNIVILFFVFTGLYYPIFITDYLYTDEAVQLWYYGKQLDFQMFAPQGRYVTEKMMQWSFGNIDLISQIKLVRLISFLGWLFSVPVWYYIFKQVFSKEGLPCLLAFWCTLYLVCTPSLSISVVWASCVELFLANTAGLISGFCVYSAIRVEDKRVIISPRLAALAITFGVISLFTYQNGFGCYFLPILIHAISKRKISPFIWISLCAFVFILTIYFLIFKFGVHIGAFPLNERTNIFIAPWGKLKFFLTRPMSSAFHFTYLFNEKNMAGYILYAVLFGCWLINYWIRNKDISINRRLVHLGILMTILVLTYLPSLIVRENYASNRTLLALKVSVFVLVAESLLSLVNNLKTQKLAIGISCVLFVCNAWYNVSYLFIKPIRQEYVQLRLFLEKSYKPHINNYYVIRPHEDFFVNKYSITRSWDEFGVPSSFFNWVPEFFVKQIIYEKTGDRLLAEKITVKHWLGVEDFNVSGEKMLPNSILINVEEIMKSK